jgi:hypothetical protein
MLFGLSLVTFWESLQQNGYGTDMIEKSYGEMQAEISMLKKENEELQERVLSLKLAVQTLEAFLKPVGKNCGSGCSCRKTNTNDL